MKVSSSYYRDTTSVSSRASCFNIFINDIFFFVNNISLCNADDITIYACSSVVKIIISRLEIDSAVLASCFSENYMKLNEDKCHLTIFGKKCKDSAQ